MRHLLLFLPLFAVMLLLSTEAAPPTLSVDSGQDIVQVAPAVPAQAESAVIDQTADVQPSMIAAVDAYVDRGNIVRATGVLLRVFDGASTSSTSNYLNTTPASRGATKTGRCATGYQGAHLLC
jgi:hypothetical protein